MDAAAPPQVKDAYLNANQRKNAFIGILFVMVLIIAAISLSVGSYQLSPLKVFTIIARIIVNGYQPNQAEETVVMILRLPRIVMGILAGAGLGISGTVFQGILRNPLASPTTIGISAAAGFGASLSIFLNMGATGGKYLLIGNAFLFSMIPALTIFGLSKVRNATPEMMILAGIGLLYIFGAITSLLQFFASEDALKSMVLWLMGDLGKAKWRDILAASVVLVVCIPLLLWKSWDLNTMSIGDESAKSLGIHPDRNRVFLMVTASLTTATIICFTGMIGFIGLVSPHICRILIGGDNRFLMPASAMFGAGFLLFSDVAARYLLAPIIIPVGVMTACAGGPLFLYLIINKHKRHW